MRRRFLVWYWSSTGGGGSQFAINLSKRLAMRFGPGSVRLSLHADDPSLPRASAEPAFETLAARVTTSRGRPLATMLALGESRRLLQAHARDCDVVIVPMNFASAAPLALALRQPLVYFAHDPAPHPGDYAMLAQRATQKLLLSRASRVVALSRYCSRELARLGVAEAKLTTAPLSAVYEPQASAKIRQSGPMRLLFAGRMIAYKGLDLLAAALPSLGGLDNWRLTVAGAGPALDAALQRQLSGFGVEVFPEWMSEARLNNLIADSDVLLAPYRSATQSGVIAQALACGRPSIVTPIGALPEQIGEGAGGWISRSADPVAVGDILVQALKDDKSWAAKAMGAEEISSRAWHDDYWAWLSAI